jgi:hypothetical protein
MISDVKNALLSLCITSRSVGLSTFLGLHLLSSIFLYESDMISVLIFSALALIINHSEAKEGSTMVESSC